MSLTITPTILLSELYYPYLQKESEFTRIIEKVADENFYRALEIGTISSQSERNQIKSIVEDHNLVLTHWMTDVITAQGLDLSSPDDTIRTKSVKQIIELIHISLEVGASNVALISGPNHGVGMKKESLDGFYESLCAICEEAAKLQIKVLVEPLDKYAHKKRFIGPSKDLFFIVQKVKKKLENIGIAFDTAHAGLNKESMENSLELVQPYLEQIHFSNAVLDPNHELYGDHHIPIGDPGFMTEVRIGGIMQKLIELYTHSDKDLRVSIEMRTPTIQHIAENETVAKSLMDHILNEVFKEIKY